ncbi:MAG: hypothetical protein KDL87_19030, partial [Verrucomicrobiae bacterium]|nr:hypothetical protein [Verrucomicrobiae bacterium]
MALADGWTQMRSKGTVNGVNWADAIDPADKCGYAYAWVAEGGTEVPKGGEATIAPGATLTVARFLAVATSPAEAVGLVEARRNAEGTGMLTVTLKDQASGQPVTDGRVVLGTAPNQTAPAYPDEQGRIALTLPVGTYLMSVEDIGRSWIEDRAEIVAGKAVAKDYALDAEAAVAFDVTDDQGRSIPCKAQFNATGDTPKVNLGPTDRAHGCVDQYFSETGTFRVPLPPGTYEVIVTRGPEHSHFREEITLAPGQTHSVKTTLKRLVQTPGWVAVDYHDHSTPSGDNTCGTDDRLINLAAEHVEFAPTTE